MKRYFQDYWTRLKIMAGAYYTLLCWAIILLGGLLLLLWVILPYADWREIQQTRNQQDLQKAAKLQALQRSVKQWQLAHVEVKAAVKEQMPGFFDAASYTQAQQDLFNLISNEIKNNHLRLMTHSFTESTEVAIGEQIAVQLHIQGALADVIQFMSTFSQHQKRLTFSSLYIANDHGNTIFRLTIAGYRLKVKAPASKP
jgi:hypothetical protein